MKIKYGLIGLMAFACAAMPVIAATPAQVSPQPLVASNNAFAYDLYAQLKKAEGNLLFSPFSVSTALAMTYAGAKGDTAAQMQKVLHFTASQHDTHAGFAALLKHFDDVQRDGDVQLDLANSIWPQKGAALLSSYLTSVKQNYGVEITPVDYTHAALGAQKQINQWVEEKTHDKIKSMLDELKPGTRLVLVNAVYFKGSWAAPFNPGKTENAPFFIGNENTVQVPLMRQMESFNYAQSGDAQIIELPYRGNQLALFLMLPKDKTLAGLKKFENNLTQEFITQWQAKMNNTKIEVFLPKFKFEWGTSLVETLQKLGMHDPFEKEKADFSGMNGHKGDDEKLYISDVAHKAFIAVDDKGTEAAAATGVIMLAAGAAMSHESPPVFRADHPFLFLIQDNTTGSILFMGRVMNPAMQ